ncbi:hypothetical protein HZS_7024 [Henneguya salminicola]|nr:hypothetical protein HZS_7024 [Henneguya salminicola]
MKCVKLHIVQVFYYYIIIIDKAYFSNKCAFYLGKFITKHFKLSGNAQLPTYMKRVCAAHFVRNGENCMYSEFQRILDILAFMRKGLFANASILMPCF